MISSEETDVCVGTWSDGRVGTFRGMRNVAAYGGYAYTAGGPNELGTAPGYEVMLIVTSQAMLQLLVISGSILTDCL